MLHPIETAPKDGTEILVPYPIFGRSLSKPESYSWVIVSWNGVGWNSNMAWLLHEAPKVWHPLPELPAVDDWTD